MADMTADGSTFGASRPVGNAISVFARVGGDEFCLVMEDWTAAQAKERITYMQTAFEHVETKPYPRANVLCLLFCLYLCWFAANLRIGAADYAVSV